MMKASYIKMLSDKLHGLNLKSLKMKRITTFLFGLVLFASQGFVASAQEIEKLNANQKKNFALAVKEEKSFALDLKKEDYAEISLVEKENKSPYLSITSPSGNALSKDAYLDGTFPFIAEETGIYKVTVKSLDESNDKMNLTIVYNNKFQLPKNVKLMRQRKINGYDAKVFNVSDEENFATFLLIEKSGKLKAILKGDSAVGGGYQFPDDPKLWDYPEGKKSAALFRSTIDKTGDGTPDVAVQFYSGGAHCCTTMYFFELGDEVRQISPVEGADSDIIAVGKKPNGSLLLQTGDSTFAYWLTSFAGSPIPQVILSYKNGAFRADSRAMKKPASPAAILRQKAAKAKKEIDLTAYTGVENSDFRYAFWGDMLVEMYAGNEAAAWQYFDLVWDKRKPGKEKFKEDFLEQLSKSDFWQQMQEGKK